MRSAPSLFVLCSLLPLVTAQDTSLESYLPDDVSYDAGFPRPESVLGWEVGTWHVRHDQLVDWYRTVADSSPRFHLQTYGKTHEERPLLLATVSSPANLARIEEIREAHLRQVLEGEESGDGPAIVWMGYSVHGNESSGSNAALLFAYHLAAAQGPEIEAYLENTVVLIDPCLNPDGLGRFAHWANMHKGTRLVGDPSHREHREGWPSGRTNHYWFDLNRDWLLLTHPESRGRLEQFHRWMPQVLTDYHEMGSDSTYFFQPGIPSRQNPLTPERNLELTRAIAGYHAAALDEIGSLYYTEESFDDFYYGKGSTYPDLQGCIGILFEQASSRGHFQENSFGGIDFPFTIKNQFTTSLSTLAAVDELRDELGTYQREFFAKARAEAAEHPVQGWVLGAEEDPERTFRMVDILRRHGVRVHRLATDLAPESEGAPAFPATSSFVVPADQTQFRLVRALFETRTSWPDNTFYDVSTWTLPLCFDVPHRALDGATFSAGLVGEEFLEERSPVGRALPAPGTVAWIFEWHHYHAPRTLQRFLEAGVRARVATRRFTCETSGGARSFDYGTIVVPTGIQDVAPEILDALRAEAAEDGLQVHAATSGLTPEGVDLGSGSLRALEAPAPLLVVGGRVSSYEAGEAWHHLDQRLGMGVSLVEQDRIGGMDLARYTHVILVNGGSSGLSDNAEDKLRGWVRGGGVLLATKSSAAWAAREFLGTAEEDDADDDGKKDEEEEPASTTYGDYEDLRAVHRVAGTIFEVEVDRTHPLAFGYVRDRLPVFRNSTTLLPEGEDPFGAPLRYTEQPLLSGYASEENVERFARTPAVRAGRVGSGSVVCLIDNPLFRGVWYGTDRLFSNALFFGSAIKRTGRVDRISEEAGDSHGHQHGD